MGAQLLNYTAGKVSDCGVDLALASAASTRTLRTFPGSKFIQTFREVPCRVEDPKINIFTPDSGTNLVQAPGITGDNSFRFWVFRQSLTNRFGFSLQHVS